MRTIRDSILILAVFTVLCGLIYPLAITGMAQALFPGRANGSFIRRSGQVLGSSLIGQPFTDPGYLWSRPSATGGGPYNAAASSGSNLGPLSKDLASAVEERIQALRSAAGTDPAAPVPVDLVTASGSGLDPHVSPAAAFYQVERIARARQVPPEQVRRIIADHVEPRQLGVLGEPRVNALLVNLALDERFSPPAGAAGAQSGTN